MKYSKISTIKFGLCHGNKECLVQLNSLIVKDGCLENMPFFDNKTIVLDMDSVENKVAKSEGRPNNKSMDSLIIIKGENGTSEFVFIEFRFNYKSMKNLKAKDLRGKKKFSAKHISDLGYNNLHKNYYYVFNPNLKEQARRYFRNLYPSMPSNFKPVTIEDIRTSFF